jgi:tetratricopeptide (TPR) repeat protein
MKRVVSDHPDLESIAAYLDGRLTERARAGVTEHLASCEDCYAVFTESALTRVDVQAQRESIVDRVSAWFTGPRLVWSSAAATLAVAATLLLAVGTTRMRPTPVTESELRALAQELLSASERPIEGRLSGGIKYARTRGAVRSGGSVTTTLSPDVRIAVARSEKALAAKRTAETLHMFGVATIVAGELDRAIPLLEQATEQTSPDSEMLNDLSAAYLARAARDNRHQDLERALAAADRALKAAPVLPEALFNRALALEHLGLVDEARVAWFDYLRADDRSGWADEARAHHTAPR